MSSIFREKALVKLKSPEQLDEALKVMPRKTRLALGTLIVFCFLALMWGIFGRLPDTGRGQGILITPNTVVPVQAQADGQITRWLVKVGDVVKKGQVLGMLDQPTIEQELDQARAKFTEIKRRNEVLSQLRGRYADLQRKSYAMRRKVLQARIGHLEQYVERTAKFADEVNEINEKLLKVQKGNLLETREAKEKLTRDLKRRLESYERLREAHLASEDTVSNNKRSYNDSKLNIRDVDLQIEEIKLKRVQTLESYLQARNDLAAHENTLTQYRLDLRQLEQEQAQLEKSDSEAAFRARNEAEEVKRTISRDVERLQRDGEIKADQAGRILELTASAGSIVRSGQRLAQLDTRKANDPLVTLAYFKDSVGKQLKPGMRVRVAPSTVSQKRYGSIVGEITSVSRFPVTSEAVTNYVGNTEVAQKLTEGGYDIEVFVQLERNASTPSGYRWTSERGPDVDITAGTTADAWVTYERRAPISFVPPILRKWSGL